MLELSKLNPKHVQSEYYDEVWYRTDVGVPKFNEFLALSKSARNEDGEISDDIEQLKPLLKWMFDNALCDENGKPPVESEQNIDDAIEKVAGVVIFNISGEFGEIIGGSFAKKKSKKTR